MQRIIKDRQVVDDRWHLLPKDATLESVPNSDDVIIPLALWLEHGPALRGRDGGLGVWLDADEEPESIAGDLDRFQVIAVNFPAFTDGRGFSSARLLRERFGLQPTRCQLAMHPTALNAAQAEPLQLAPGSPALYLERLSYAEGQRVVEFDQEFWRPDALEIVLDAAYPGA